VVWARLFERRARRQYEVAMVTGVFTGAATRPGRDLLAVDIAV